MACSGIRKIHSRPRRHQPGAQHQQVGLNFQPAADDWVSEAHPQGTGRGAFHRRPLGQFVAREEHAGLPGLPVRQFVHAGGAHLPIEYPHFQRRIKALEAQRVPRRLSATHPATIRVDFVARADALDHHHAPHPVQGGGISKQPLVQRGLRDDALILVMGIFRGIGGPAARGQDQGAGADRLRAGGALQ